MSLLDIRVFGDPVLRRETEPVTMVTDDIRQLVEDMYETMHAAEGIGLAAPQVGRTERIAVVDIEGQRFALINPEIVSTEGVKRAEEGCLSIPEVYAEVERAERVVIRAIDVAGNPYEVEAADLLARCMQHEIDHLHGKLIIDYLSMLKKRSALSKWDKVKGDYPGMIRKVTAKHDDKEL